jgi:small subunit ribosomal protein S18
MTKKIKLKISSRLTKRRSRRGLANGAKQCRFCVSTEQERAIDYKNSTLLYNFLTERGKILPSRISGVCSKHQRTLSGAIKKSRTMALVSYIAQS